MKSIVIFYSRTGNTKYVAEQIASNLNSEILPLIDKKDRSGIWGWLMAGRDALKKAKTEIEDYNIALGSYDLIFIGCPNWAGQIPPAIRTFLDAHNWDKKKFVQNAGRQTGQFAGCVGSAMVR